MKTPKPPSANKQAEAQQRVNRDQAALGQAYNRPNQYDAFGGSTTWQQTGTDAQGNPIFAQSTQLGDTGQQYAQGLAGLGQQYFQGAQNLLANPADLTSQGAFDQAYQYATANLEPRFERSRAAMESRLRNQGLDPTSEAFRTGMNDLALQQNEARNNLVSGLQGQMFNQALQGRQQQVGELTGLTAPGVQFGNQVLNPGGNFAPMAGVNVGSAPNMPGIMQANYQQQVANQQGMLGGLASLGGSILAAPMTGGASVGGYLAGKAFGM